MKNFFKAMFATIMELFQSIRYFIRSNLKNFAKASQVMLPYLMFFIAKENEIESKKFLILCLSIPIIFYIIIFFLKSYANKIGKGESIPSPSKRFTSVREDGEVSIESERIQELILYLADLEDWLEKRGRL